MSILIQSEKASAIQFGELGGTLTRTHLGLEYVGNSSGSLLFVTEAGAADTDELDEEEDEADEDDDADVEDDEEEEEEEDAEEDADEEEEEESESKSESESELEDSEERGSGLTGRGGTLCRGAAIPMMWPSSLPSDRAFCEWLASSAPAEFRVVGSSPSLSPSRRSDFARPP